MKTVEEVEEEEAVEALVVAVLLGEGATVWPELSFLSVSCLVRCSSMRSQALPRITMDPRILKVSRQK